MVDILKGKCLLQPRRLPDQRHYPRHKVPDPNNINNISDIINIVTINGTKNAFLLHCFHATKRPRDIFRSFVFTYICARVHKETIAPVTTLYRFVFVWTSLESTFSYVQSFCTSTVRWELMFFSCLPPFPRTDRHYIKERHYVKNRHYITFKRTKNLNFVFAGRM